MASAVQPCLLIMTPQAFIARWKNNPLLERAGAQPYFDDICELLV